MLTTTNVSDISDTPSIPSAPTASQPAVPCCSNLKSRKLLLGVLAGLIILILISAAAFGAYQLGKNQAANPTPTVATPSTPPATPSTNPIVEPASDPTANWRTITLSNLKLRIPNGWFSGSPSSGYADNSSSMVLGPVSHGAGDIPYPYELHADSLTISEKKQQLIETYPIESVRDVPITIAGITGSRINGKITYGPLGGNTIQVVLVSYKGLTYSLINHSAEAEAFFDQILSTFKFL